MTKIGRAWAGSGAGAGSGVSRKFRFASYSPSAASGLDMIVSAPCEPDTGVRATRIPECEPSRRSRSRVRCRPRLERDVQNGAGLAYSGKHAFGGRDMVTARRVGRWALYGLGGCLVLAVLVRAGIGVYLGSSAGRAMVARKVGAQIGMPVEVTKVRVGLVTSSIALK